jgi:apolipoprotein N-acyltransferase
VDIDPLRDPIVNNDLRNLVDASNIPMVLGAVLENERSFSNASILWQPKIGPTSIYRKMHLTPFGEYIPLRTLAEHISTYAKGVTDFLPGDVHVIHSVAGAKIAPIICYELIDDSLGRQLSASSNLLLVQTNSATFGTTSESRQQLGIARIRAIEHQRYLVSVSTTGISAIVDPKGRVRQQTHLGEIGALQAFVELLDRRSFSDRYGGQGEILLMVLPPVLIALGWLFRGKRKKLGVPQ